METLAPVLFVTLICAALWEMWHGRSPLYDFSQEATVPLRGALALLVILGHLDNELGRGTTLLRWIHWSTPAVAVFFFMSGYGYQRALMTKVGYLSRFVSRTAIKLFVPLALLSCVYMIVLGVRGDVNVKEIFHEAVTVGGTLFLPNSWYVFALMFYSVLFWCVGRFEREGNRIALLLGLAVAQYCFFRWVIHWDFVWWWSGWSFFIGVLVAHYEKRLRRILDLHPSGVMWSMALFYLLFSGLKFATRACWPIVSELPNACTGLIVYLLVSKFGALPWGRNLGKVSYEIYLVHGVFIVMFRSLGLGKLEYCLLVVAATIVAAFGLNRVHGGVIRYLTAKVGLR